MSAQDLAALASRARERCAARGGARGALVAAQEELAAVAAGKRSAALSAEGSAAAAAAEVLATLAARGGPRDARAAVGARAAAAAAAAAALAGAEALPKPWRAGAADAAAALAEAARELARDGLAPGPAPRGFWALGLAARRALHGFAMTKGKASLGAADAADACESALGALARAAADDDPKDVENDRAAAARARDLGDGTFDGFARAEARRAARAAAAAGDGAAAVAVACLRRFSSAGGGGTATAVGAARARARAAACGALAALRPLGGAASAADGARAAGPLLLALEDGGPGAEAAVAALAALLDGRGDARDAALADLAPRSADLAAAAARLLLGPTPRDVARPGLAADALGVLRAALPVGTDALSGRVVQAVGHALLAAAQVAAAALAAPGGGGDDARAAGHVLARGVAVARALARRGPRRDRAALEALADDVDGAESSPAWAACGKLRRVATAAELAELFEALRDAADARAVDDLVAAGAPALLLDALAPSEAAGDGRPRADAKPWAAMWALKAAAAVAAASPSARALLATRGAAAAAVGLAGAFPSTAGVRRAALACVAALLPAPGAGAAARGLDVVHPADLDEDGDAALRDGAFETAELVAAAAAVGLAAGAATDGVGLDAFRHGVADCRTLAEDDGELGVVALARLLPLADRPSPFDGPAPPRGDDGDDGARDRHGARRAAHGAARRLLRRRLRAAGAAAALGDYVGTCLVAWHDRRGGVAAAALAALGPLDPRVYWRGDLVRGVEVATWFAKRRAVYGAAATRLLIAAATAGDLGGAPGGATVACLAALGEESAESLEAIAPALEALWGAEADDVEHREKLEGFGGGGSADQKAMERRLLLLRLTKAKVPKEKPRAFAPETSDRRAYLPFHKPPSPKKQRARKRRSRAFGRAALGTRGSSRASRSSRGSLSTRGSTRGSSRASSRSRASSNASTADSFVVDRLLSALPRGGAAAPVKRREPLSLRPAPLPARRPPKKLVVSRPRPSTKAMAARHRGRAGAAESGRERRTRDKAKRILASLSTDALPATAHVSLLPKLADHADLQARAHRFVERGAEDALLGAVGARVARTADMAELRARPNPGRLLPRSDVVGARFHDAAGLQATWAGAAAAADDRRAAVARRERTLDRVRRGDFFKAKADQAKYDFD